MATGFQARFDGTAFGYTCGVQDLDGSERFLRDLLWEYDLLAMGLEFAKIL